MSGINTRERSQFNVDNEHIDLRLGSVNTILVAEIVSISNNTATVSIANKYSKLMPNGNVNYQSYGTLTTNFATPSLFQYTPSPGDKVLVLVSQSNIQSFLNQEVGQDFPSKFNICDSVLIPISPYYDDPDTLLIGSEDKNINIIGQDFDATINTFNIEKGSDNLVSIIANTFQAIGAVTISGVTIDVLTGGAVSAAFAKLEGFL